MAVFTPVELEEAERFLEGYDLGALLALDPVHEGVENTNYRLETSRGGVYALTLFEKRVNPDSLPFYLGLTEHLADRGYPAPRPQRDRSGRLAGVLNARPAAIIDWLPGEWLRMPAPAEIATSARMLAELGELGADFPLRLRNSLGPEGWRALIERASWRAKGEDAAMLSALAAETTWLETRWPDGLPQGAIHADYFPDNVLFTDGRVSGVIDYYFACTDSLAYDLAIALSAWGFAAAGEADDAALTAFRAGYGTVRALAADEREALPLLCRGAAVRFSLTRLHDRLFHDDSWKVTPKDPAPYFRRLQYFQRASRPSTAASASAGSGARVSKRSGRSPIARI
jgi:homoserine kinase type II